MSRPRNRWLTCLVAGTTASLGLACFLFVGCGGTSNGADGGSESGVKDQGARDRDALADARAKDARGDAPEQNCRIPTEGGPTLPDGAASLVNTFQDALCSIELIGLTDDDKYVIYYGNTTSGSGVFAAPLAGGSPITLVGSGPTLVPGNYPGSKAVTIVHSTVFAWTGLTTEPKTGFSVGALSMIWTPTRGGQVPIFAASSTVGLAWASTDSTKVAFTANVGPDGGTGGDLVVANSDLTGVQTLLVGSAPSATADVAFVIGDYFVAAHRDPPDSGTTGVIVSSWAQGSGGDGGSTGWVRNDLLSNILYPPQSAFAWSAAAATAGDAGATVVAISDGNMLEAIPVAGGSPVTIDEGVSSFYVKPDGTAVFYGTTGTGYNVAPLPAGTPTPILSTGYGGFVDGPPIAVSPDGNWSVFYTSKGKTAGEYDLSLVHNVAAAVAIPLSGAAPGAIVHDAFTFDSAYALYYAGLTSEGKAGFVGQLMAYPVAGPKAVSVSKHNVRTSNYLAGSTIIYGDNFEAGARGPGLVDISIVDVSTSPLTPTPIIQGADENYLLTTTRNYVVFALNTGNTTTDGIYSYPTQP